MYTVAVFGHGLRKQSQLLPSEQQIENYTTVKEAYTRNGEIQLWTVRRWSFCPPVWLRYLCCSISEIHYCYTLFDCRVDSSSFMDVKETCSSKTFQCILLPMYDCVAGISIINFQYMCTTSFKFKCLNWILAKKSAG